jgi:membrane protease YdiL (CAAX protease family)
MGLASAFMGRGAHAPPVGLLQAREWLVRRRWAVALATGLALVLAKRLVQSGTSPPDPLVVNGVLYLAVPLALAALLMYRRQGIGLALPVDRAAWAITGAMALGAVALAFAGTLVPSMMAYYPQELWGELTLDAASLVPYEAAIALIMLAVELLFRGWLVLATSERLGGWAVILSAAVYAVAHLGKPPEEVVFSLLAGLAFGWADIRARSILPSFAAHFIGSALFDVLALLG